MSIQPLQPADLLRIPLDGPRPSFSRALWRIASADVSSGNRVTLLRDGPGTFEAMLAMIDAAQESVEFEGYIYRRDEIGMRFAKAFVDAAERGVRVRVLMDWVGRLPTPGSFFRKLIRENLDVRLFNPPGFRAWLGLLPRDHRKVLVVDGKSGVTGGIGIGLEWNYGMIRRRKSPWRDTSIRIDGDAVQDLLQAFERMWERRRVGAAWRGSSRHGSRET